MILRNLTKEKDSLYHSSNWRFTGVWNGHCPALLRALSVYSYRNILAIYPRKAGSSDSSSAAIKEANNGKAY